MGVAVQTYYIEVVMWVPGMLACGRRGKIAQNSTKRHCRACNGILRQHKMKIILATAFFLCAFVAFAKANNFAGFGEETGDLEDDLEALEIQDASMEPPKPPINSEYAAEALLQCFIKKHKGMMDKKCIKEFKELLPASPNKRRLFKCAVRSFQNCTKKPEGHETTNCMWRFSECMKNVEEGSGWFR